MKTKYLILAAAALVLAACAKQEEATVVPEENLEPQAMAFDAYLNRGTTTRSGETGTMTLESLKTTGFGVFAYYTDNNEYDSQFIPNFMYNQKVEFDTYWKYDPIKYWPNEYGSNAISDDADKVSFFAYAPYVTVTPSTGKAPEQDFGITNLSRNAYTGDPYVKFMASFDWQKNVDLLWGVVPADKTQWDIVAGEKQVLEAGKPWLNVERPLEAKTQENANQRVKFNFRHALSQLNVQVDYDADMVNHGNTDNPIDNDKTRIYVRSVTFTGFAMKGALNLNNIETNTPYWLSYDATTELEVDAETTIYDGRKDGREGAAGAVATNEKNAFLNPTLIQTSSWVSDNLGVQNGYQNLFRYPGADEVAADLRKGASAEGTINATQLAGFKQAIGSDAVADWDYVSNAAALSNWPVLVIPNGEEMTITIVYDVETVDKNLSTLLSDGITQGSSIQNVITKTISFGNVNYMEAGKKYTVLLHLGMNSVKFDADVVDWGTSATTNAWLPSNKTTFQAPGVYNYTVVADATSNAVFDITGFAANEGISVKVGGTSETDVTANGFGVCTIAAGDYAITANASVLDKTTNDYFNFHGNISGKEISLFLIQKAAQPDGEKTSVASSVSGSTVSISLKDKNNTALEGAVWTGNTRNVTIISATRNGVPMTELDESATSGTSLQFWCSGDGEITIGTGATTGETFVFTIKAGDGGEFVVTIVA